MPTPRIIDPCSLDCQRTGATGQDPCICSGPEHEAGQADMALLNNAGGAAEVLPIRHSFTRSGRP